MIDRQSEVTNPELNTTKLSVRKANEIAGYLRIRNDNLPAIEQVIVTGSRPSSACARTWENCLATCYSKG